MNLQAPRETQHVSLSKKGVFPSIKRVHLMLRNAEISARCIRDSLFQGKVGPFARTFALQFGVDHFLFLTVALQNMFNFVPKNEPKIVNAVIPNAHPNNGGLLIKPKANTVDLCIR